MTAPVCGERFRKATVTDRQNRYRAHSPGCKPDEPKVCGFCGSDESIDLHHIDGEEKHIAPENLMWACRPCNTKIGVMMFRAGVGRLTRQYNPAKNEGAKSLGQWLTAVMAVKGESETMGVSEAVEMIHATPAFRRSMFAHEIWKRRRSRKV